MSKVFKIQISKISGKGLFTMQNIAEGELIIDLVKESRMQMKRDKYTIEYNGAHYIHPRGQFINHSKRPNMVFSKGSFFAKKDIKKGEEITFNYNHTESEFSGEFRP